MLFKVEFKAKAIFENDDRFPANAYRIGKQVMTHIIGVRFIARPAFVIPGSKQRYGYLPLLRGHFASIVIVDVGTQFRRTIHLGERFGGGVVG